MDTPKTLNPPLILLLLFFFLLYFITAHSITSDNIEWWCRSVPHPAPCRYYLSHSNASLHLKNRSDFYKLSVEVALDLAIHAEGRIRRLGASCDGDAEKSAWLDCWKLSCNTVRQLNRTLSPSGGNISAVDAQTWLSAALTNLYTCNKGFTELKANSSFMQPVLRYNVSDLISNCLAINNASFDATVALPRWAAWAGGRRLMQASGRADFVVARDGSGNFNTIKAALQAAAARRRSSRSRIVIHVKAGVYDEVLVIVNALSDLTITGDGKGKTIITGKRSVSQGFTTFSSPTVSKNLRNSYHNS